LVLVQNANLLMLLSIMTACLLSLFASWHACDIRRIQCLSPLKF